MHEQEDRFLPAPESQTLHELVAAQARRTPALPAVWAENQTLSYAALEERAGEVARALVGLGAGPGTRVAVCVGRGVELAIGLLGTMQSGAAYVPLDPHDPPARLRWLLAHSRPLALVAQRALSERLPARRVATLWLDEPGWQKGLGDGRAARCAPDDPAYLIYTSGSTGRPKGVLSPHRALLNLARWQQGFFGLGPDDRVLHMSTPCFDASVWEFALALAQGAQLVIAPEPVRTAPDLLQRFLAEQRITVATLTPTMLGYLRPEGLPDLHTLIVAGEACHAEQLRPWLAGRRVFNAYGPTEAGICATIAGPLSADLDDPVPIGRPISGVSIAVLDARRRPVRPGASGELYIAGAGLALGYWNRPRLTAERFVACGEGQQEPRTKNQEPFEGRRQKAEGRRPKHFLLLPAYCFLPNNSKLKTQNSTLYKTGDRVRLLADGSLAFLGRLDRQIKISGHRIEPAELEQALRRHPAVRHAAAFPLRRPAGLVLAAAVVLREGWICPTAELHAWLQTRLPPHLVPARIRVRDALPLLPSGKIDRRALAQAEAELLAAGRGPEPADALERQIAAIWAEVLGLEAVGRDEHLLDLGGHSLAAGQIVARLHYELGLSLSIQLLFEHPTVAALRAALGGPLAREVLPPSAFAGAGGLLPLAHSQEQFWMLEQWRAAPAAHASTLALRLRGVLDQAALVAVLEQLVARHDALRLRISIHNGVPFQQVAPAQALPLSCRDHAPHQDVDAALAACLAEVAARPFDLSNGPLMRMLLVRIAPDDHLLVWAFHHLVVDGWSLRVLLRELDALYQAACQGLPGALPALPCTFADAVRWQHARLSEEARIRLLAFWRAQLLDAPPTLDLPLDFPRPPVQSLEGAHHSFALDARQSAALEALARHERCTAANVLLALWAVLLARFSGQPDLLIGVLVAARGHPELAPLAGCLVNTLVLRADLRARPGLRTLLHQIHDRLVAGLDHADLPLAALVEAVRPPRAANRAPLVQALFSAPPELEPLALGMLAVERLEDGPALMQADLCLTAERRAGGWRVRLDYDAALFAAPTAARLARCYQTLLEAALAAPDLPFDRLALLPAAEQAGLLLRGAPVRPEVITLHGMVAAQARLTPERVAVATGEEVLSYAELEARSNQIAQALLGQGVGPGVLVAVCLARGPGLLAGLLGVLKTGAAYLPLDPQAPPAWLGELLADSQASALLTETALAGQLPAHPLRLLLDDPVWQELPGGGLPERAGPADLAYLIYTSGSTGQPKGVMVEHRQAVAFLTWARSAYSPSELRGVAALTAVGFDLSVFELFLPLVSGGTCVLLPHAFALGDGPPPQPVTLLNAVPSVVAELVRAGAIPASVETVNLAGETPPPGLVRALYALGHIRRVYNLYGPTETTTYSTRALLSPDDNAPTPIGLPIDGSLVAILDEHMQPVPPGVVGEIYIGGAGPARGYHRQPGLTAERFVPFAEGARGWGHGAGEERQEPRTKNQEPGHGDGEEGQEPRTKNQEPGQAGAEPTTQNSKLKTQNSRLYRTGDFARLGQDGLIYFVGRRDRQVKVRGCRVELDQVELAIARLPRVHQAAVAAAVLPGGATALVAAVVADASPAELLAALRRMLPAAMVPASVAVVDRLPLTPNGKVDYQALPQLAAPPATTGIACIPPRNTAELRIARIWEDVLGSGAFGVHDHFFDLGGTSLQAAQVVARLRDLSDRRDLALSLLFREPTIERLALILDDPRTTPLGPQLIPLQPEGERPPFFAIHPLDGRVMCYVDLARQLGTQQPFYGLQAQGAERDEPPVRDVPAMAAAYLRLIRALQPEGPYHLGGYSLGGYIAYEIARLLEAAGEPVGLLALWDVANTPHALSDQIDDDASCLSALLGKAVPLPAALLRRLGPDEQLEYVLEQLRIASKMPEVIRYSEPAEARRRLRITCANLRARVGYTPGAYGGALTLFRTRSWQGEPALGEDLGWSRVVAGRVALRYLPGEHTNLFARAHTGALAAELLACLPCPDAAGAVSPAQHAGERL